MLKRNYSNKKNNFLIPFIPTFFLFFLIAFSILVIKDFSGPLVGLGDEEQWEYAGFYLAKNITLFPFPHLDINNNQVFYPYGTSSVFQPWSVERDLFFAGFYSIFGFGSWIQLYYLLTVIATAIGTFLLLFVDYGVVRASGAALLITFFNFYATHKYPAHLSYSVIHWTVLSFIADFLIVKRLFYKQSVSLRLILVRACLVILSLGQELGYIAGYALMSLTVSWCFIVLLLLYRYCKRRKKFLKKVNNLLKQYRREFLNHRSICLVLIGFCTLSIYAYLPLVIQIVIEAKKFDFTGIPNGVWWANPYRLFIPFFPALNPNLPFINEIFKDSPEGLGAGSPGWFLLILGIIGLWQSRKKFVIFIPLIIIFLLCLFYHPANFPTLKIFPWFTFNRVAGRVTVIYPVILVIFALEISFENLEIRMRRLVSFALICLACLELHTSYSMKQSTKTHILDKNFFKYMEYVKSQPGEAVLDWPFCITGGNAVGAEQGLCPYYNKNHSIFALRRFHEKKIMGQYFGRLHPFQLEPYLQAGWEKLFVPNSPDIFQATQQVRCFRADEWSFFTDFYKYNDFAGINLYTDFLPKGCAEEFYTRFGNPVIETSILGAGKVKFIPKPANLREQVNLALGSQIKFEPTLKFADFESDLIANRGNSFLSISGLSVHESDTQSQWRWALGRETNLIFKDNYSQPLHLYFRFQNPIEGQNVLIEINGVNIKNYNNLKEETIIDNRIEFTSLQGINRITFKYKDWNHNNVSFAPNDSRKMSVLFTQLQIKSAR